jgi:predicted ATPase
VNTTQHWLNETMSIVRISIQNYKSLRSVTITPKPLSVLVGANASGKTNFADCLDFIGDVYRHGLEVAVGRKGGYENIAFRRQERTTSPIRIELVMELSAKDSLTLMGFGLAANAEVPDTLPKLRMKHSYEFLASTTSIRSEFRVIQEQLIISEEAGKKWRILATIHRDDDRFSIKRKRATARRTLDEGDESSVRVARIFRDFSDLEIYSKRLVKFSPTELIVSAIGRFAISLRPFLRATQAIRVFQISPTKSRESGVPTPNPELGRSGENLPAVIDEMQKNQPNAWSSVMEVMRAILPDLKAIKIDYTSSKRLGLFFQEEGYGRSWSVEEVSDGTLQTLALLVTIFDPEAAVLVLEELENSVHPWIIRRVLEACRLASMSKQIILTTHSPIVMNAVEPKEMWVIWREDGQSHLKQLPELNQELLTMWGEGIISTFDYIDSGALPPALPPPPSDSLEMSAASQAK